MKRVNLPLPDEAYYELQAEAGKERMDTEDYIRELLIDEVNIEIEDRDQSGHDLQDFALDWDWPNKKLKEGTTQAKNVVGVLHHMKEGLDFPEAVKRRADAAREEDPDRGSDYEKTVRADCTKRGQGVTSSVDEFKTEAEMLIESFQQNEH